MYAQYSSCERIRLRNHHLAPDSDRCCWTPRFGYIRFLEWLLAMGTIIIAEHIIMINHSGITILSLSVSDGSLMWNVDSVFGVQLRIQECGCFDLWRIEVQYFAGAWLESVLFLVADENLLYTIWSWPSRRVDCSFNFTKPDTCSSWRRELFALQTSETIWTHFGYWMTKSRIDIWFKVCRRYFFQRVKKNRYNVHTKFGQLLWSTFIRPAYCVRECS